MGRHAARDLLSLGIGAAFLLLYCLTAAPGLLFADSGELQTVALLGGIPHSTGYPLWVIVAHAFTWIPIGEPVFRVTLFSAVMGALALALMVRRLGDLGVGPVAAAIATALFGLSFSFWRVSIRAEVYTLSVVVALLGLGAVLSARRDPTPAALAQAGFLLGLVLAVHLSFAPAVAVAGIALIALAGRGRAGAPAAATTAARGGATRIATLAVAFLAGLTPYLALVAFDAAQAPVNFLDLVRHARSLLGTDGPPIDSPWQGVGWLVTGRNVYPPHPLEFHPRSLLMGFADAGALLLLFEWGPVAAGLVVAGWFRRARRDQLLALLLLLALIASMLFAALLQVGAMLHLFQLPAILIGSLLVADGIEALLDAARARGTRRLSAALAIGLLAVIPPVALRVRAEAVPIGPRGWQVHEEDRSLRAGWFPAMPRDREAERWSRVVLDTIPPRALVMATWSDFTPLRHRRLAEGRRPDLTVDQIAAETLALRLHQWQSTHELHEAPIVFTSRSFREAPFLDRSDSIAVGGDRYLYVLRQPLDDELLRREIEFARVNRTAAARPWGS